MDTDDMTADDWVRSWVLRWFERSERWENMGGWMFDVYWRVIKSKQGWWLHLYEHDIRVCSGQEMLGDAEWSEKPLGEQCEDIRMAIEKRAARGKGSGPAKWLGDSESAMRFPQLVERLTAEEFADGSKRKRDTLTMMAVDRSWRAVLNDKETGESLWVAAESLVGLLEALELELMADEPNWRDTRGNQSKTKK